MRDIKIRDFDKKRSNILLVIILAYRLSYNSIITIKIIVKTRYTQIGTAISAINF